MWKKKQPEKTGNISRFPGEEQANSMLTTRHYPDLGSASDWAKWRVINMEFLRLFRGETISSAAKRWLFSRA